MFDALVLLPARNFLPISAVTRQFLGIGDAWRHTPSRFWVLSICLAGLGCSSMEPWCAHGAASPT